MVKLVQHPWVEELIWKENVRMLEIYGGAGFGEIALATLL